MTRNGYEVTFQDFLRLVSDPYCLPMVAPLLKQWFNEHPRRFGARFAT